MEMDLETFQFYQDAIKPLRAEDTLRLMSAIDYPHTKMESRRKMHKSVFMEANPFLQIPKASADQFFGRPKVKPDGK